VNSAVKNCSAET